MTLLIIGIMLVLAATATAIRVSRVIGKAQAAAAAPGGKVFTAFRPHLCPKGGPWMPSARTRAMKIGEGKPLEIMMTDPSGQTTIASVPTERGVVICEGVFCSGCGQRLMCRCGKTPLRETVLEGRDALTEILSCCERPTFGESDAPDSASDLSIGRRFGGKDMASS